MTGAATSSAALRRVRLARFAAGVSTALLLLAAAAEVELVTRAIREGITTAVGIDVNQYLEHTRRWLAGGPLYLPAQLAGPYVVEDVTGNVYPPSLLYLTAPFALGLPMPLWYATPMAITALAIWRARPAWWAAPILALVLAYHRTWTLLLLGNPGMWAIAFAVAGVTWGWPAIGAALKLTFAPLALLGVRRRSWWIALAVALAAALPFGSLWWDYATVILNTRSSRGPEYLLGEWPIALGLVLVAWSGARRRLPQPRG